MSALMAQVVYVLCAATALLCAWLLLRGYSRKRLRLLLWSGLCFTAFALENVLVFVDLVVFPDIDLSLWRNGTVLLGLFLLLYGLIWDAR